MKSEDHPCSATMPSVIKLEATPKDESRITVEDWCSSLGRTLYTMLDDLSHTDVTLATVDGAEVSAHGCILSAASPALACLLKNSVICGKIDLAMPRNTLLSLLEFIYTGSLEIPQTGENFTQLLKAAQVLTIDALAVQLSKYKAAQETNNSMANSAELDEESDNELVTDFDMIGSPDVLKNETGIPHVDEKLRDKKLVNVSSEELQDNSESAVLANSTTDTCVQSLIPSEDPPLYPNDLSTTLYDTRLTPEDSQVTLDDPEMTSSDPQITPDSRKATEADKAKPKFASLTEHHTHTAIARRRKTKCPLCPKRLKCLKCHEKCHKLDKDGKPFVRRPGIHVHEGDKRFQCKQCVMKVQCMVCHVQFHHSELPYKCTLCPKAYAKEIFFKYHMMSHSGERRFVCSVCGKGFISQRDLKEHEIRHTDVKAFECSICSKCFHTKKQLGCHVRIHSEERNYPCKECSKKFRFPNQLTEHFRRRHEEKKQKAPFQCEHCKHSFKFQKAYDFHLASRSCLVFGCEYCPEVFARKRKLQKHLKTHTADTKPHICSTCQKGFAIPSLLRNHEETHSGERPFSCSQCNKAFRTKSCLKMHEQIHSDEKPFCCETCGKLFRRRVNLEHHEWTHINKRPFVCSYCPKAFSKRYTQQKHERTHTKVKPFSCQYCSKAFSCNGARKRHERIHTGEKPYVCPVCGSAFNQINALKSHQKNHNHFTINQI